MKNRKKLLAAALAAVTLSATLLSCGEPNTPATTTEPPATSDTTEVTEAEFVPTGEKYGGEFTILVSGKTPNSNFAFKTFDETDTDRSTLDEAVYRRMKTVEELYGIKFNIIEDMGGENQAYTKLLTAATAANNDYDAAVVAAYDAVPLASASALCELGGVETIHLDKDRWDQRANEDLKIRGLMYFSTGDIDFWDDMQQNVVAFNKQVKRDLNIEDNFYEVVEDGKWTLDKLAEYAKLATEDLNSDSVMDMSDKFGIITWDDSIYAVFEGSGERVVTAAADGSLELTLTGSERIVDVLSKYTDICFGGDAINYQRSPNTSQQAIEMFSGNRALFILGRLQSLDNYRNMDTDYGILPYPKYEEAQSDYHTAASPYHMTFFCIPASAADPEKSGAVLDALAYYGSELLTPAYYEKTLTGQYFRDEDSAATLELMASTRAYDIGLYVQPANINKQLIFLFREGSKSFASTFDSYADAAKKALETLDMTFALAAEERNAEK